MFGGRVPNQDGVWLRRRGVSDVPSDPCLGGALGQIFIMKVVRFPSLHSKQLVLSLSQTQFVIKFLSVTVGALLVDLLFLWKTSVHALAGVDAFGCTPMPCM